MLKYHSSILINVNIQAGVILTPDIFAKISWTTTFSLFFCETLLEGPLRDILWKQFLLLIKVQPIYYNMKLKKSLIMKTENFESTEIFKI